MLRSEASANEADDDEDQMVEVLDALTPKLKAAWDKNSAVYNAELTSSVIKPGEPGYVEQERQIAAARFVINSQDMLG